MTQDIRDPFAEQADDFDPFASADEATSGGPFIPWPSIEDVAERLVVMVPRTFDPAAPVSEYAQKTYGMKPTQEEWRVDLVVLDGGKLEYTYRAKEGEEFKDATYVIDLPALIPGWRVSAGNIQGVLNKVSKLSTPLALGRIRAGYTRKQMDAGRTFEEFAAEREAFYANPRGKTQPKPVWHLVISETPEDKALALAWYRAAVAEGFKIS